jgi:hypothetical protein
LADVPTWDMTPAEYERSDTPGTYWVVTERGARLVVSGLHSAKATAGEHGTYEKVSEQ